MHLPLFLLALFCVAWEGSKMVPLFGALLCCLATFTGAWGLATWLAFAPAVLINGVKLRDWKVLIIWLIAATISVALYAKLFDSGYEGASFITARGVLLGLLDCVFLIGSYIYPPIAVGKSYVFSSAVMFLVGFVLCLFQFFVTWRLIKLIGFLEWAKHPLGMALIYCVLSGLMTAIGRAEFYPFSSLTMRYTSISAMFIAVLVAQSIHVDSALALKKPFGIPFTFLAALFLASTPICWAYAYDNAKRHHEVASKAVSCLRSADPFRDFACYKEVYSDTELPERQREFRKLVHFMKANKICVFRPS
jgi:hypothetical protein